MKQLTYICDRCKKPIVKDVYRLYVGIVDPETDDAPECSQLNKNGDSVLCSKCLAEIDNIICEATTNDIKEEPKKEPKKTTKKQIIDGAKLQAMRDSGMTLQEIAEKVGCCQQTVLNRLNAMSKEK